MDLLSSAERDEVLFYFRRLVRHYDHSRLALVNRMARSAGVDHAVHQDVRPLPEDNGERFYGDYYLETLEREKTIPVTKEIGRCRCDHCFGSGTLLPFQMLPTTAPAASTISTHEEQEEQDNVAATATTATTNAATVLPLVPTTSRALVEEAEALQQCRPPVCRPPVCFSSWPPFLMAHPPPPIYYYGAAPYQQQLPPQSLPFVLAHQQQLLAHQQRASLPKVAISSSQPRRRRKPMVVGEYQHCCKKYWTYQVVDKPEGRMGAPPHCLDCPVRKQRRHPSKGPKGPR
jgi:hypothetical protein